MKTYSAQKMTLIVHQTFYNTTPKIIIIIQSLIYQKSQKKQIWKIGKTKQILCSMMENLVYLNNLEAMEQKNQKNK